jgi:hypothetical protein
LKDRFKRFELYNGTTGNYDTVPIAEFATITFFATLTINGNNVDYWLYQYNKPDPTDESKIKLFFF